MAKYPTVSHALRDIRNCARDHVKLAELGGDGGDMPFEQAFSNLAHAYLRDKAPSLLDHELGFQLLDRNQENTKAVGVFGFKVGSNMLYAPVFFLQGDLKGHELLYIKNQDMFVPMKENWLNYILNRKPNILGESVTRNSSQLGVQQPDLNRLSKSPWKYAAAVAPWCRDVMPKFAHTALTDVGAELDALGRDMDLKAFCKQASLPALEVLVKTCEHYPALAQEIIKHHGDLEFLSGAIKAAGLRARTSSVLSQPQAPTTILTGSIFDEPAPVHPIKSGKLKIISRDHTQQTEQPEGIDEEDAEKLLADGVLIKDERDGEEVSVAYNVQVEQKLFNPQESGIFFVLTQPGEFKKCFVVHHPHGAAGRKEFATIIELEGEGEKRRWMNCHPTRIWCVDSIDEGLQPESFKELYDKLPDATNENVKSKGGRKVLIGPRGNGTLPFRVQTVLGDEFGGVTMEVSFSDHCEYRYAESILAPVRDRFKAYDCGSSDWTGQSYDKWQDGERVHFDTKDGTDLRSNAGDLYIPKGYKLLTVALEQYERERDDDESIEMAIPCGLPATGGSKEPPMRPGNLADAELHIFKKTAALKVSKLANSVYVNDKRMTTREALCHLVGGHGLREKAARAILDSAKPRAHEYRIKYANPFGGGDPRLTGSAPSAPGFPGPNSGGDNMMGFPGPTQNMEEYNLPVQGMNPVESRDAYRLDPGAQAPNQMQNDFGTIQKAMQSGQKEIFDTAALGSMLKAVRDDTMIDRYLPKLVEGMDRLGRILFMFYWHGDKFADRYGKQDMPELEDTLRNAFEMMGDTILFLKQKTIEPYPEEDAVKMDLQEPANA